MPQIASGLVYFNAGTTGSEIHLPFGGMKARGNGHRELGGLAVDEFSEIKSVYICYPAKKRWMMQLGMPSARCWYSLPLLSLLMRCWHSGRRLPT